MMGWQHFAIGGGGRPVMMDPWNAFGGETLSALDAQPHDALRYRATIARREVGRLGLVTMTSDPARATSEATRVGPWAMRESDALLMSIDSAPPAGSDAPPSQWLWLRDMTRPWEFESDETMRHDMVKLPYSALAARFPDPEALIGIHDGGTDPAVAATIGVVRSVFAALGASAGRVQPGGGEGLAGCDELLADLIVDALALMARGARPIAGSPAARDRAMIRRRVLAHAARHLDDPDLSPARIAEDLGIGLRSIQRAFIETGETASRAILALRLDHVARALRRDNGRSGCGRPGTILELALDAGFGDASHFSRAFVQRFGVSPRRYRES